MRLVCGNVEGQTGETKKGSWPKDDCRSLPGCTGEGCNYVIECLSCRKAGLKRRYYGETSCSPYQKINEYLREVREGVATHPLVAHFREEYGSIAQEILMRILSTHLTSLDRQVKESLNIFKASGNPDKCLNMKSEWGGAKLQNLKGQPQENTELDRRTRKESGKRSTKERRGYMTTRVLPRKFRKQNLARE